MFALRHRQQLGQALVQLRDALDELHHLRAEGGVLFALPEVLLLERGDVEHVR